MQAPFNIFDGFFFALSHLPPHAYFVECSSGVQVAKAAKAYRVYFSKTDDHEEGEDYLVDHSIVLYLIGPDGEFLDVFTQRSSVEDCVMRIKAHMDGGK